MTVKDIITGSGKTCFSFEVLPPLKGTGTDALFRTIDKLREFSPEYINVTTHRSEEVFSERPDGTYERCMVRRRPGTVAVAAAIQQHYDIKVVPHVVCSGFSRDDIEYLLLDLQFLGITDLLVLRGDKAKSDKVFRPEPNGPSHAIDLEDQINDFNKGFFIDGSAIRKPGCFDFGVACYPEKHEESPNPEQDLFWLRKKVERGASYAVTQMFFDNSRYFDFVRRCRENGIDIPIVPGIKPFAKLSQITMLPKTFHLDLPEELAKEAVKCRTDEDARNLGIEWCTSQCKELMKAGVPSLHFYTTSAVDSIVEIARRIY